MAMDRASLTWLCFVALSLTSCHLTKVAGRLPVVNYINIAEQINFSKAISNL